MKSNKIKKIEGKKKKKIVKKKFFFQGMGLENLPNLMALDISQNLLKDLSLLQVFVNQLFNLEVKKKKIRVKKFFLFFRIYGWMETLVGLKEMIQSK